MKQKIPFRNKLLRKGTSSHQILAVPPLLLSQHMLNHFISAITVPAGLDWSHSEVVFGRFPIKRFQHMRFSL